MSGSGRYFERSFCVSVLWRPKTIRPLRHLELGETGTALVEVTSRTLHSRFLLLPSSHANAVILGILGRAQQRFGAGVCGFVFLSTHFHLILRVRSSQQLGRTMQFVNSNIARKIGRLYGWRQRFFGRRYRAIQISDEDAAQLERLKYLLRHGAKERLVKSPLDWPGVHCAWYLCQGRWEIEGWWEDQTAEYRARVRGEKVKRGQFRETQTLQLSPLPCWSSFSRRDIRSYVREMVAEIEAEVRESGAKVLGVERILKQRPHDTPTTTKKEPAPDFHAASKKVRQRLRDAYRQFLRAYREAAELLRNRDLSVRFPDDCFPPPLPILARPSPAS